MIFMGVEKAKFCVSCENCYDRGEKGGCIYVPYVIDGEVKIRCPKCGSIGKQNILMG